MQTLTNLSTRESTEAMEILEKSNLKGLHVCLDLLLITLNKQCSVTKNVWSPFYFFLKNIYGIV